MRAARALVKWSADRLAEEARLGVATVRRAEQGDGVPAVTQANGQAITVALETAGVEFISENGGGAGVRLRKVGGRATDHSKPAGPATDVVEAMDQAISRDRKSPRGTK